MNHPGEIAYLTNIVRPEIGVITNVSESHIGYFGSKEAIAEAKFELLANMCDTGTAVLNVDDTYVAKMVDKYNGRIITFGINNPADVKAVNIKDDGYKIRFSVEYDKNKITQEICMPVLGKYNVYNALAACCVVLVLGLNLEDAVYALNEYRAQPLRMEVIEKDGVKIINDTYNANPASVKMALTTLQKLPCTAGCKIVVLGDMLELGKWSDILHQDIGKFITDIDDDIDMLITVGESAALIAEIVESKSKINVITCDNNQEVIAQLKNTIKPNDIVLVKGSRKMRLDEVVDGILS
jgi:UDP-N-acetylmuramoyl-tripeptide--D-alanyl-D-alanine ligase